VEEPPPLEGAGLRVLHTNFLRGWGGQSNRVLVDCLGLAALGHEVLVSAPPRSELAKRARAAGLEVTEAVTYAGGARPAAFGDIFRMRRVIAGFRPDLIHLHGGRDSWAAAAALLRPPGGCAPRVIRTKHNVFPIADHFLNRWQYGSFFEMIVCLSRAIVEQCAEKPYIRREKLVTIPSAVDCARFDAARGARDAIRREFGFGRNEVVVAMTGRLRPEKGHAVLVVAVPEVLKAQPDTRFLLIGSGSLGGDLAQTLEALGLADRVKLTGFRDDVPECLSAADVYAQPSLSEGLGTSVLEACAAGLSVAASDVGGIPDVIEDGRTGILTKVGDARSVADALIGLIADAGLRARLGAAARAMVAERFSVQALVRQTDEAYARLLASPRVRG
jgi:glycosyltransferase involved in cell wall biosynthesis